MIRRNAIAMLFLLVLGAGVAGAQSSCYDPGYSNFGASSSCTLNVPCTDSCFNSCAFDYLNTCDGFTLDECSDMCDDECSASDPDPGDGSGEDSGTPPCAIPVNFSSTETNLTDGSLYFQYSFQSSTGNINDLSSCRTGETVWYPTTEDPYVWPLPMVNSSKNPTVLSGPGNYSFSPDRNYPPSGYKTPYYYAHFTATQRLWWSCPCYNNNQINLFVPDITIDRKVFQDTDGKWKYRITKSGFTNTVILP